MSSTETVGELIRFSCPYCGKRLQAKKQKAGKPVTCPGCDEDLVVPKRSIERVTGIANSEKQIAAILDEVEQEQSKRQSATTSCAHCQTEVPADAERCPHCQLEIARVSSRSKRKRINRAAQLAVGWGISLIYYGLILSLGTFLMEVAGILIGSDALVMAGWFVQLLVIPMGLVGKAMCIAAPARYGQRYAILASLAEGVALVLWLEPPFVAVIGGLLGNVASLVSYLLFLSFLVALSSGMKQSGAATAAREVMNRTVQLSSYRPFCWLCSE